jgi:hypothetical protein
MYSPYVDAEIISLDVGPKQTRYRVHRAILAQSAELDAKPSLKLWGEKTHDTISLPELDELTAHTLVHFLYTGRYNSLEPHDAGSRTALSQYKLGTCAYCAAIRYKLPGLAELAKQTMITQQDNLTILDVLVVAREHAFPLLPDDESWFSDYLQDAIHAAAIKDADLFTRPGFVDQIEGDRRYRQVVMKAIVNSYSQPQPAAETSTVDNDSNRKSITAPVDNDLNRHKPVAEDWKRHTSTSTLSPIVAIADSSDHNTSTSTGETVLDEITPTLEEHVAPEPYTDELGFESSKTFQNQKMGAQAIAADTVPVKPAHVRNDSVLGIESTASDSAGAEKQEPVEKVEATAKVATEDVVRPEAAVGDAIAPAGNAVEGTAPMSKKSKKKGKKKGTAIVS